MKNRENRALAITLRADEREVTVEMNGHITKVSASKHLWELQELLASCEPELIFLDLHLPITFGVQLLDILRQTHPGVPIATQVESKVSDKQVFLVEAIDGRIVLSPFQSGAKDSVALIEEGHPGTASFAAGAAEPS